MLIDKITKEQACIIERELIKKYKTKDKNLGYNIAEGGFGGCTVKGKNHRMSKTVYQYGLDGKFIREWENAQRASEKTGVIVSDIHLTCRNKNVKRAGSYMWRYEKFDCLEPYVRETFSKKSIIQLNKNFEIVNIYKNISYVDDTKFNKEKVVNCCTRKALSTGDFYWSYADGFNIDSFISYINERIKNQHKNSLSKRVCQCDLDGNILHIYENARDVEEKTGFNRNTIQAYCKRKISNCGATTGYIWKYA